MMRVMKTWIARNRVVALVVLAVLVVAAAIALVVALSGDDDDTTAPTTTSTSAATTTTSEPSTTTTAVPTTTAPAVFDPAAAVWPVAATFTRYQEPGAAAAGFATDFVGFTDVITDTFEAAASDAGSGEVGVRARAGGPVTTVALRQLESDGTWWVVGATTRDIVLTEPAALATISSPVPLEGRSTAFEGTVQTQVRQDRTSEPLAESFVMGGATGTPEPFTGTLTFSAPSAAAGAIVLYTASAESGAIDQATVVRVRFAGG